MDRINRRPSPARRPHSLHILDTRHIIRLITNVFVETEGGHQIPKSREIEVVNWCVLELVNGILRGYGQRLTGHYCDDDGKTLLSQMTPTQRSNLDFMMNGMLRDLVKGGRTFSAMMTGYDVILSKELEYSGD